MEDTTSAEGYLCTFKGDELADVCYLGEYPRTMYVNFETRCYPIYMMDSVMTTTKIIGQSLSIDV